MEVLNFEVSKKEIRCDKKQIIGDNDYIANFTLDEEWEDKEVICRVVWTNKTSLDIKLENSTCVIPAYIIKAGKISVGIYTEDTENYATSSCNIGITESIKEKKYSTAVPNEEIWKDIQDSIKNSVKNSEFEEKVNTCLKNKNVMTDIEQAKKDIEKNAYNSAEAVGAFKNGSVVSVNDASSKKIKKITLFGKSVQDGTPSISTPANIVSVCDDENIKVAVCGKNLIDYVEALWKVNANSATFTVKDGVIKIETNTSNVSGIFAKLQQLEDYKEVTVSFEAYASVDGAKMSAGFGNRKSFALGTSWKHFNGTFDVQSSQALQFYGTDSFECTIYVKNIQVEHGKTATDYEEFKTIQTATIRLSEPLRGIPVENGGNYTDADGQQWITDTLEILSDGTGKLTKRINNYVIKGNNITTYTNNTALGSRIRTRLEKGGTLYCSDTNNGCKTMCNASVLGASNATWSTPNVYTVNTDDGYDNFYLSLSGTETKEEFESYLNGTPIELLCAYINPIEAELTNEQLQEFLTFNSYNPNTVITTDGIGDVGLDYIADTKKYIDNKFEELANMIVALGATE